MKSKVFPIAFFLLLVILTYGLIWNGCNSAQAQGRGDKAPATNFTRDSTITLVLIHPNLRDTLVFQSATGNAPLADSAITLRLQKLTTGHFLATSADSLYKILIDSSDWARYIRDGGITKRSAFSPTAFDSLQGSSANNYADNWVIYATHSRGADSSFHSQYSTASGTATYALHYIGTDTIPAARYANISSYADVAGTAVVSLAEITSDQWADIRDSIEAISGSLSVVDSALESDSTWHLHAAALNDTLQISAGVRASNIPTSGMRAALGRTITNGAALSSTNPVVDSTGMYQNMVVNQNPTKPIRIGFRDVSGTMSANNVLFDTTHATNKKGSIRWVDDQANDTTIFNDSLTTSAMINSAIDAASLDYVGRGMGGMPDILQVGISGPTVARGRLWVDTTAVTSAITKVYTSAGWVSASGAAGTPTDVSTARFGNIDADSLLTRSRNDTMIGTLRHTGKYTNTDTIVSTGKILVDTMYSATGSVIFIGDTITSKGSSTNRMVIGRPSDNTTNRPVIYTASLNVGSSGTESATIGNAGNITWSGTLLPNNDSVSTIGGIDATGRVGGGTANAPLKVSSYNIVAKDSLYVASGYPASIDNSYVLVTEPGGIVAQNTPISINGSSLFLGSSSTIQGIGPNNFISLGGTTWDENKIVLGGSDSIQISSSARLSVNSTGTIVIYDGGEVLVKDDSVGFADLDNTSIKYHLVNDSIWQSGIVACPDPTPTNPVITENWHTGWWKKVMRDADSLYTRRLNPRDNFWYKATGCDDSTYFGGENNNSIVWPVIDGVPIELPGNQHLIGPWVPVVLPPANPIVIDSGANIYRYNDPNPGYPEHIIQVSERFDGRWGFLTGKFQTLKQACDSLPNFRIRLDSCVTSTADGGTFRITPLSSFSGNNLRIYRGESLVASSIRDTLPDFLKKQGTFVKFRLAGQEAGRWCEIQSWPTDTTFTIIDSVLGNYFTSVSTLDSVWDLTLAIKTTIEILPPVSGGQVIIDSTVTINDECPVRIKGTDKNEVVLSNFRGTTTLCQPMIQVKSPASYDTCYVGMPIEISDMTIYADTLGATNNEAVIEVAGNARFENMNIVSTIYGQSKGIVRHNYFKTQYVRNSTPFLIFENVTCALDSDGVVVGIIGDSTDFQSYNSVYSVSGDSGCVLLLHDNNWPTASTHNPPTFFGDQIYFGTSGARLAGTWTSQAWDSISVVQSHFIGIDGVSSDGSGVLKGDLNNIIPNGNNSYNSLYDKPPTKLKALPIKAPYIPKK